MGFSDMHCSRCGRATSWLSNEYADAADEGLCMTCHNIARRETTFAEHQAEVTQFAATQSPFVRRNLDCAQYPKARGSWYEG